MREIIDTGLVARGEALRGYELNEVIGRGAFATVYGAHHVRLGREVAIKWLAPELVSDTDARQRFAAEARLLASLDHPHVVRIYDYIESEPDCALVMERLRGGTLAGRAAVSKLSPAAACALVIGALHGLEHAHQRGILHRDLKPENLLFGSGALVKVADFGIAKVLGAHGTRLTATAGTIGTPAYMAPEQVKRSVGPLSAATDVWGLGAVLYELLSGCRPYAEAELIETLIARITTDPRPLGEIASDVPARIADTVMRALARDPGQRFQSAHQFATVLERAVVEDLGSRALERIEIPIHRTDAQAPARHEPTLVVGRGQPSSMPEVVGRPRALEIPAPAPRPGTVKFRMTHVGGPTDWRMGAHRRTMRCSARWATASGLIWRAPCS